MVILILDYERVMAHALAAQSIRAQLAQVRTSYQEEFQLIEQELRAAERELAELRGTVSETEFADQRRTFEERIQTLQAVTQRRVTDLERAEDTAFAQVRATMLEIVGALVEERGASMVVRSNLVVMAETSMEITNLVLERLDTRLPHVDVILPGIE